MEIDHEIISTVILLPSADLFKKVVVSYKRKYVHELLVNRLFKPAQEKVWLGELTIAVDLRRKATKQTKTNKTYNQLAEEGNVFNILMNGYIQIIHDLFSFS